MGSANPAERWPSLYTKQTVGLNSGDLAVVWQKLFILLTNPPVCDICQKSGVEKVKYL